MLKKLFVTAGRIFGTLAKSFGGGGGLHRIRQIKGVRGEGREEVTKGRPRKRVFITHILCALIFREEGWFKATWILSQHFRMSSLRVKAHKKSGEFGNQIPVNIIFERVTIRF